MANQAEPGTMRGAAPDLGPSGLASTGQDGAAEVDRLQINEAHGGTPYPPFHGRAVSWAAVSVIMAGFLIGGLAMVFGHDGPRWWLFWVGAGLSIAGLLVMLATKTFEDWY